MNAPVGWDLEEWTESANPLLATADELGETLDGIAEPRLVARNPLFATLKLAMRRDIAVIIFLGNVNFLSTWLAALLAMLTRKRVLFWTHGWLRKEQGTKANIRNLFYRLAHGLLLYGNRAKMIGIENGFAKDRMYVVYNSLDYQTQKTIMRAWSIS